MASSPASRTDRKRGGVFAAFGTFAVFILVGILGFGEVFSGLMAGGVAFVVYRQVVVRGWLLADHSRGVHLSMARKHDEALAAFRQSASAWDRRAGLDRWRAPLLASASRWGFADQARYNQALCLYELDRGSEAVPILQDLLEREPAMGMARALLEHIESSTPDPTPEPGWGDLAADLDD